ncbi:PREDICTED: transmembrane glycoprotein NMB [Buceros rhinoceros silvestris]|uniref:transmembrane glycoprotein NMB n=1 Tax=Buceros rhinoceros silvestris TaxID=175836 RepID=UPI0005287475|nr:PREDICTED: transmembrane glycoprotein NMB [Buceros rhinoceros silvestris]
MSGVCHHLRFLLLAEAVLCAATTRYQDVLSHQTSPITSYKNIQGWSSDQNKWNEKLYPFWEEGDPKWKDCWKGGRVTAKLDSDSPALVGSNVTFFVSLKFPKCQKEDNDGNIVYERNCTQGPPVFQDQQVYVYNWTEWIDNCGWENCTSNHSHVFPDGRPFPHHPGWRRRNFVYVFHTFGQYHQTTGRSSVRFSVNTANITLGKHTMTVSIYRRGHSAYVPIARANAIYVVTDKIPIFVSMFQKHDRNISDSIFIKDSPITFDVKIHDPSSYLNNSAISYKWNFGDGSGLFVTSSSTTSHTFTLQGNFTLNLTAQAIIPVPCKPVTSTAPLPTSAVMTTASSNSDSSTTVESMEDNPDGGCHIYRNGYYSTGISVVEGILEVNIIQMMSIQMTESQAENSLVDFVVNCQGSLPTDVCTVVSDPTCQVSKSVVCDPVVVTDECLLTIRRAFEEPGTYCINITLRDDTSQALASTLIAVNAGSSSGTTEGVFIFLGLLAVFATIGAFVLYKRYKQYKPIERSAGQAENQEGLTAYFSNFKAIFFPSSTERNPLLKSKPGIV